MSGPLLFGTPRRIRRGATLTLVFGTMLATGAAAGSLAEPQQRARPRVAAAPADAGRPGTDSARTDAWSAAWRRQGRQERREVRRRHEAEGRQRTHRPGDRPGQGRPAGRAEAGQPQRRPLVVLLHRAGVRGPPGGPGRPLRRHRAVGAADRRRPHPDRPGAVRQPRRASTASGSATYSTRSTPPDVPASRSPKWSPPCAAATYRAVRSASPYSAAAASGRSRCSGPRSPPRRSP